jgi:hypothetical protein
MTLIYSEVSKYGIIMVADSSITYTPKEKFELPSGKRYPTYIRLGAEKIKPVPNKPIAISFWGMGKIDEYQTDIWLDDFITTKISESDDLDTICNKLIKDANFNLNKEQEKHPGGFHIGGISNIKKLDPYPIIYHIHKGTEDESIHEFRLYKDWPDKGYNIPEYNFKNLDEYKSALKNGNIYSIRNGMHQLFARSHEFLWASIRQINKDFNFEIPSPNNLESREKINRMILGFLCDLYSLSNQPASVGRPISSLTIDLKGEVKYTTALRDVTGR